MHARTHARVRVLVPLLVIALLSQSVLAEPWAYAQPPDGRDKRDGRATPQDYFIWEFLGGAFVGAASSRLVVEAILTSWCRDADDPEFCKRSGRVILRPLVYPLLVFVGTTAGILAVVPTNTSSG